MVDSAKDLSDAERRGVENADEAELSIMSMVPRVSVMSGGMPDEMNNDRTTIRNGLINIVTGQRTNN